MSNLSISRKKLLQTTIDIALLLDKRFSQLEEVFKQKNKLNLESWDPIREKELYFEIQKSFDQIDETMLLILSLIIEKQASDLSNYPRWSMREHLKKINNDNYELINPVFLKYYDLKKYGKLNLKEKYKV